MRQIIHRACIAVAGLILLVVAADTASATIMMNPVNTTARAAAASTFVILRTDGGRLISTCGTAQLAMAVGSSGAGTSPLGSFAAGGCQIAGVAGTVTQTAAWSERFTFLLLAGRITGVLLRVFLGPAESTTALGLRVAISALGCSFDMAGPLSILTTVTPTTPPALAVIGSAAFGNSSLDALALVVSNATGNCSLLGIVNGSRAGYLGTLALAPAVSGTLI